MSFDITPVQVAELLQPHAEAVLKFLDEESQSGGGVPDAILKSAKAISDLNYMIATLNDDETAARLRGPNGYSGPAGPIGPAGPAGPPSPPLDDRDVEQIMALLQHHDLRATQEALRRIVMHLKGPDPITRRRKSAHADWTL